MPGLNLLQEGPFGMVFQHFNLFPHLTVLRNIDEGMRGKSSRKEPRTASSIPPKRKEPGPS